MKQNFFKKGIPENDAFMSDKTCQLHTGKCKIFARSFSPRVLNWPSSNVILYILYENIYSRLF